MVSSKGNTSKTENASSPNANSIFRTPTGDETTVNEQDIAASQSPLSQSSLSTVTSLYRRQHPSRENSTRKTSFKRRTRAEQFFDYTHNLNRRFAIAMVKLHYKMQKDIIFLTKRCARLERTLAQQMQYGHPIIRIPRLTKDQLSAVSHSHNNECERTASTIITGNELNQCTNPSQQKNNSEMKNKTAVIVKSSNFNDQNIDEERPFCRICKRRYKTLHRFEFHCRKYHTKDRSPFNGNVQITEDEIFGNDEDDVNRSKSRNSSDAENESAHLHVNPWDLGEGRLRPRSKPSIIELRSIPKVKCKVCNKLFKANYIEAHIAKKHKDPDMNSHSDSNQSTISTPDPPTHESKINQDENGSVIQNRSPMNLNIAAIADDDCPIEFPVQRDHEKSLMSPETTTSMFSFAEPTNQIIISTSCLKRDQMDTVKEFLETFKPQVSLVDTVTSNTTHLIINDDEKRYSPLSLKLLQAITHHCFCVSFNWIIECNRYDRIIDATPFEILGVNTNEGHILGPRRSRQNKETNGLFEKYAFIIKLKTSVDSRFTSEKMKELIINCHGTIIDALNHENLSKYIVLVVCDRTFLADHCPEYEALRQMGIRFIRQDWITQSILDYQVKKIENYEETRN